jgi:hypothetical protein
VFQIRRFESRKAEKKQIIDALRCAKLAAIDTASDTGN